FLRDGGAAGLAALAEQLTAAGDLAGAGKAFTLLGTAAWSRADRPAALSYLDRAVELFDALPDTPEKANALLELARAHMLNFELRSLDLASGHGLATSFADEAGRSYFSGDWAAAIAASAAALDRPTAEWDLQLVPMSAWLRELRAEAVGAEEVPRAVAAARRG